ncbi:MAG: Ldh family oxidoreductase [Anaerolineae bacterium]|nr:Ldh family oxidoreductase [Anaerolineae bacterium]
MPNVEAQTLTEFCKAIIAGTGASEDLATTVAASLVRTNLMGHDSHGVIRVKSYLDLVQKGAIQPDARPRIERQFGATATVDCQWGFGQIGARLGAETARDLAQEHGIGCVTLAQVNHIGRLGEYAEIIAQAGLIGIVMTSGTFVKLSVTPYGGREPIFGTNPMAWAVPTSGEPFMLDFATAAVANGKVAVALSKGEAFPPGMLLDQDGNPTTDPASFYHGGMLLPFGTYKGSGLALMMEIIPTILAGFAPLSSPEFKSGNPTLMLAINLEVFTTRERFDYLVEELLARVKQVPPAVGFEEVLLPGEKEARSMAQRLQAGVPLPDSVWHDLTTLAGHYGVAVPERGVYV